MMPSSRNLKDQMQDLVRVLVTASIEITDAVEAMHRSIGSGPKFVGSPFGPVFDITVAPTYQLVRKSASTLGRLMDRSLNRLSPLLEDLPAIERHRILAILNGVFGDYLAARHSSLAIDMQLYDSHQHPIPLQATKLQECFAGQNRLLILIHGSCLDASSWQRQGSSDYGQQLASELGMTPLYLNYNSGRHIYENGDSLDALLQALYQAWPEPIQEIHLLGHSMGGLVARSAIYAADQHKLESTWRSSLRSLITLGTPHQGAPLERWGHWLEGLMAISPYASSLSRLAKVRSAGVKDLRYGHIACQQVEEASVDGQRAGPIPLPQHLPCLFIAASKGEGSQGLRGDGLVPIYSALAKGRKQSPPLASPHLERYSLAKLNHLDLLAHAEIANKLSEWLQSQGSAVFRS